MRPTKTKYVHSEWQTQIVNDRKKQSKSDPSIDLKQTF